MSKLNELSEYAKSKGVSSRLKPQIEGHYTLFIMANEFPSNYPGGVTMWKDVFTIDELDEKWVARFDSSKATRPLSLAEVKFVIDKWAVNPSSEAGSGYECT
jgi:gamma-glutamylcyclotransferase (GGCT)/AIG2-like uncharacterized protein YtfP